MTNTTTTPPVTYEIRQDKLQAFLTLLLAIKYPKVTFSDDIDAMRAEADNIRNDAMEKALEHLRTFPGLDWSR